MDLSTYLQTRRGRSSVDATQYGKLEKLPAGDQRKQNPGYLLLSALGPPSRTVSYNFKSRMRPIGSQKRHRHCRPLGRRFRLCSHALICQPEQPMRVSFQQQTKKSAKTDEGAAIPLSGCQLDVSFRRDQTVGGKTRHPLPFSFIRG